MRESVSQRRSLHLRSDFFAIDRRATCVATAVAITFAAAGGAHAELRLERRSGARIDAHNMLHPKVSERRAEGLVSSPLRCLSARR